MKCTSESKWHIAYTFPNFEKKVNTYLKKRNYNVYLPMQKVLRQWSDRKKKLEVPLFPNYIFLHIKETERWNISATPGIVRFVSCEGRPSIISETEINAIKAILSGEYTVAVEQEFSVGDKVRIVRGPLTGLEGVLSKKQGEQRFILTLETMAKVISINIDAACFQKIEQPVLQC